MTSWLREGRPSSRSQGCDVVTWLLLTAVIPTFMQEKWYFAQCPIRGAPNPVERTPSLRIQYFSFIQLFTYFTILLPYYNVGK